MKYGSVCSGIEAATVAWEPLGWKASFFSEIENFPRSVLKYHHPNVPCHGDFTTIMENQYEPIDLLVGGTPCQSFSIAGLRGGLEDQRGNLALEFILLAKRLRPKWLVWENVPGVLSSNNGRDFGSFLGGLAECGYGFAYRVLDAQYFGVPQRRRRVFVVGCLGNPERAAKVLFEPDCLRWDIKPSRKAKKKHSSEIAKCLTARGAGGQNLDTETANFVVDCLMDQGGKFMTFEKNISGTLRSETHGHNPIVMYENHPSDSRIKQTDVSPTVTSRWGTGGGNTPSPYLQESHSAVRRLTPIECERLMGFPDNYTKIGDKTPDSPRYKALGNSMAVPVMAWIGKRIDMIEKGEIK